METLKLKLVFDRRKEINSPETQGAIEVYVYDSISRKNIYIPTGIKVLANQFRQKKGERGRIGMAILQWSFFCRETKI